MGRLALVLTKYLEKTGQLEIQLGNREQLVVDHEHNQFLIEMINKESIYNKIIVLVIFMYITLYLIGIFLVFHFLGSPAVLAVIFGGIFVTPILIVKELKQLWKDKNIMDIVRIFAADMPPAELIKVIKIIYYTGNMNSKKVIP